MREKENVPVIFWIGMADWIRWKQHKPTSLAEAMEMARGKMKSDYTAKGLAGMEVDIFKVNKSEDECSEAELAQVKKVPGAKTPLRDMTRGECFDVCRSYGIDMSLVDRESVLAAAVRKIANPAVAAARA